MRLGNETLTGDAVTRTEKWMDQQFGKVWTNAKRAKKEEELKGMRRRLASLEEDFEANDWRASQRAAAQYGINFAEAS